MARRNKQSPAGLVLRCVLVFGAVAGAIGPSGCLPKQRADPLPFSELGDPPEMPGPPPSDDLVPSHVPLVRLRLINIQVPVGTASDSEDLWSYLNEEPVNLSQSVSLGGNGLRIGLAPRQAWADLAKILRRMTGRKTAESFLWALPGKPLSIVLKQGQPIQTMFTYYKDRTLSMADYPPGDNVLAVLCTINPDDRDQIVVTAQPQIRATRRAPRYTKKDGAVTFTMDTVYFPFRPMTFHLRIRSGDLIVIGPAPAALWADSVGHHFLIADKKGMPFETVLILIPKVEQARVRAAPPGQTVPPGGNVGGG